MSVIVAYAFTVLMMKRSILTEKISRRGFHLSREYAIDPLEILFVREVMRTNIITLPQEGKVDALLHTMRAADPSQRLFPVVDQQAHLSGVLTRIDLQNVAERAATILEVTKKDVVTAFPDEPLRVVVYRMAETGLTRMPVVARGQPLKLVGMISLSDLLRARTRDLEEEHKRERVLRFRVPFGFAH